MVTALLSKCRKQYHFSLTLKEKYFKYHSVVKTASESILNVPFSLTFGLIEGKAQVLLITLTMTLFYSSVTVSRDSDPACTIPKPWKRIQPSFIFLFTPVKIQITISKMLLKSCALIPYFILIVYTMYCIQILITVFCSQYPRNQYTLPFSTIILQSNKTQLLMHSDAETSCEHKLPSYPAVTGQHYHSSGVVFLATW